MNDKELLELAAKAARIEFADQSDEDVQANQYVNKKFLLKNHAYWNPLTDDGDALRLAVQLEINLHHEVLSTDASVFSMNCGKCSGFDGIESEWAEEALGDDPYTATRRAIVRAAAEIGKTK